MLIALLILLLLFLVLGGYGSTAGWGYYGWSPLGLLLIIVLFLLLTGGLHL